MITKTTRTNIVQFTRRAGDRDPYIPQNYVYEDRYGLLRALVNALLVLISIVAIVGAGCQLVEWGLKLVRGN